MKLGSIHLNESTENGHIDLFNGRLRDECRNVLQFDSIEDASEKIRVERPVFVDRFVS